MSHSEPTQNDADSERQAQVPEPEILPRARRRQPSAKYEMRILFGMTFRRHERNWR